MRQASTIYTELPIMWEKYKADPDEMQMKGEMDKLLIWVLHLVIPAILIGTGRYMIRTSKSRWKNYASPLCFFLTFF